MKYNINLLYLSNPLCGVNDKKNTFKNKEGRIPVLRRNHSFQKRIDSIRSSSLPFIIHFPRGMEMGRAKTSEVRAPQIKSGAAIHFLISIYFV